MSACQRYCAAMGTPATTRRMVRKLRWSRAVRRIASTGVVTCAATYHARVQVPSVMKRVLARPLLWWAIAAVWLIRDVYGNLLAPDRPDARALVDAGYA